MRIAAGELDRRIKIYRAETEDDGTATVLGEPDLIAERWARKLDVSDAERVRAAQQATEVTTRFLVRSDPVTRVLRGTEIIMCRDLSYDVTGFKESRERDDAIEITAVARPDQRA